MGAVSPVVFVCENNHYGMSMASDEAFAIENISTRATAYGFPGVTVDGSAGKQTPTDPWMQCGGHDVT